MAANVVSEVNERTGWGSDSNSDHSHMDHGDHHSMPGHDGGHTTLPSPGMDHGSHGGMNHGGMDHGGMDHGGMDHGGMDHGGGSMCSMSMVWNTDPTNLCLVFPSWRITSTTSLYSSLLVIVLLGIFYEWLRLQLRILDRRLLAKTRSGVTSKRLLRRGGRVGLAGGTHRRVASANNKGILISSLSEADGSSTPSARRAANANGGASADASGAESDSPFLAQARDDDRKRPRSLQNARSNHLFSIPELTLPRSHQVIRSLGYAATVSLSFFLMLLFMTYNAWIIGAVVAGAALGHYLFQRPGAAGEDEDEEGDGDDFKGMACH